MWFWSVADVAITVNQILNWEKMIYRVNLNRNCARDLKDFIFHFRWIVAAARYIDSSDTQIIISIVLTNSPRSIIVPMYCNINRFLW